jgi:hypothetical protein
MEEVQKLSAKWTGVARVHLTDCAAKAVQRRRGGVIVGCIGANKADVVFECLMQGDLINHLLIDQDLADGLKARGREALASNPQ